ncbi:MAG TPA: sigma-70 family RNA polymerase sigma factor [Bryobacteraceae bacterium]
MADTAVGLEFESALTLSGASAEDCLLEGLRRGEEAAYETLIQDYEHPVFNLVSRLVDDSADAADVVQEVFIKVFRKVASFRGESSLRTWIYRIAVNEARNQRRWFTRHKGKEVTLEPTPGETQGYCDWLEDAGRSPFEVTLDRETEALIESALRNVNPAFRAALVLREIEGFSYEEVAEILQISMGTVKSKILRGREALRKSLTAELDRSSAVSFVCGRPVGKAAGEVG